MPNHSCRLAGPRRLPALALVIAAVLAAVAGCAHVDPYENVEHAAAEPQDPRRLIPDLPAAAPVEPEPVFVGALPAALADVDVMRRALMRTSKALSGERSAYDAALWTLTPYMLYRAVTADAGSRDTSRTLIAGSALLGAGYGFLSARPKEFERIYLDGTARLTCLMADHTRYLYTEDEFGEQASGDTATPTAREWQALAGAIADYRAAAAQASRAVAALPAGGARVTCAVASDCGARRAALGRPAPDRASAAAAVLSATEARAERALRTLVAQRGLMQQVQYQAAHDLRIQAHQAMQRIEASLKAQRPEIGSVSAALTALKKSVDDASASVAKAQSRRARDEGAGNGRAPALPRSIPREAAQKLADAEQALAREEARAATLLATHEAKSARVDGLLVRLECNAKSPPVAAAGGAVPASSETPLEGAP